MPSDLHLSPELLADQKRGRRRWIIFGLCLVLAIPAEQGGKALYVLGKGWRARQLARQAEEFIAADKLEEAADKARSAYQLKLDEPDALRAVAHQRAAAGRPGEALTFWKQLSGLKAMSSADRRAQAEDFLHANQLADAIGANAQLLAEEPNQPQSLRLAARLAVAVSNRDLAIEYARRARTEDPGNLEGKLLLALLQADATDPDLRRTGVQALLELSSDQGRVGLTALTALSSRSDVPAESLAPVTARLRDHPLASDGDRFRGLDLEIRNQPSARSEILDRAQAENAHADPARRRALGVWLNSNQEFQRTLVVIPLADALQRKDLLLVHLDALAGLKRWTEIVKIVGGKRVPLDPVYNEIFLARGAMEQGDSTVAQLHWSRAHTAAEGAPAQMWFIGQYAERLGENYEAGRAYEALKTNASSARPAYEALLRIAGREGNPVRQRVLLGEMCQRWPKDNAVANDYAYLSLLAGSDLPGNLKRAHRLVDEEPNSLPHRTTLALALLRQNDARGALGVYAGLRVEWDRVPATARAVHIAVLGKNGQFDEARREAKLLPEADLRVEERELVQPWRDS